ncbi:MAG TPA: response regulator [Candidatus Dormibacteraeota bacterium]|jgi:signal transduction histidine kinase/DNA-binding response OmpR family regulator
MSVGFLMVAVGPLVFFGAQRISSLFTTQNETIQQKHEPMAETLAQAIYGYILAQSAALQSTASQIESNDSATVQRINAAGFDPARLNSELAAAHTAEPALLQLYVGNLAGRAVASDPPAGAGVDYSQWTYVKEVLNPRRIGPKYSDVVRSSGDTSVAAVVIAVPILDSQRNLLGYLAGTVGLSEVQRLSVYSKIGLSGQAVVVDRRGRVIAHPRDDWRLQAKDLSSEAIFQQSLGTERGVSWYTDLDGNVARAAGFATVPVVGWKVWVSQSVAELRAELTPLILSTLEWLLVAVVLALVLGFVAAMWLSRPVGELNRAAARIAQGDFVTPVRVREGFAARELLALAQTFNQMAHQMSGAYQTLEEKVSQRTQELQNANQELARANKLKSEFLANVSHELRTPLSAIIGFSQILLDQIDGPLNEEQHQDIQQVNRSGQSLLNLINQILDLSKIEAGKMELSAERLELPGLVNSVLDSIRPLAEQKGLRIETRFPLSLPAVEADPVRLKQILINLLSNAVKFTDRGHIEVFAQPSGRMVRIAVKDTGIGISGDSQKVIFEEFVQGDGSSTRRHGGTGLGLSIVRKLVEMHGGAITVVSEPGQGSTFMFTLPAWASGTVAALPPARPRRAHRPSQGLPGNVILVVDDDASVRQLIARHLEQEGWKTVQASNAADAVQLAHECRPVLMTLDVMMPDASGWWVLEKLREDPETAGLPVLVVTIIEDQRLMLALGASDYLAKPYDRAALVEKVHHLLPQLNGKRVLVVDDDPEARILLAKILGEEGARVELASDGNQAMLSVTQTPPDLVLLDLMMPGMSGFEIVARMRALPVTAQVPVIIVSAKELSAEDILTLDGHIQRFIAKGTIDPEGLTAAVRQVLGQVKAHGEAA